jgi:hypothetical protein
VPPEGVKVAKVDYEDVSSITKALEGQDALIITLSTVAPPGTQAKLVEAAAAANVPYVLPNYWGPDLGDEQYADDILAGENERAIRALIEKLGKSAWIGTITGHWYEYSLGLGPTTYGMDWKQRKFTFYDDGETKVNAIVSGTFCGPMKKFLSHCQSRFVR